MRSSKNPQQPVWLDYSRCLIIVPIVIPADDSPKTKCSFKLFAQLDASSVPKELMEELEREFDEPTGITTVKAPELSLQGVLMSQNCGILYEIKHAVGVQYVLSSAPLRHLPDLIGRTQRLYGKITTCTRIRVPRTALGNSPDNGAQMLVFLHSSTFCSLPCFEGRRRRAALPLAFLAFPDIHSLYKASLMPSRSSG